MTASGWDVVPDTENGLQDGSCGFALLVYIVQLRRIAERGDIHPVVRVCYSGRCPASLLSRSSLHVSYCVIIRDDLGPITINA